MKTEVLNPTWEAAVEIYMAAIEHGSGSGKQAAKEEIRRLAREFNRLQPRQNAESQAIAGPSVGGWKS